MFDKVTRNASIYIFYILVSSILTAILNIIHSQLIHAEITTINFIMPTVAGCIFGVLLAEIKLLNRQLNSIATTDQLTQTFNRMQFDNFLEAEIDRVNRYGQPFTLIFMDIDHFKNVNDQYGHHTGDIVLSSIAQLIKSNNRTADIFARYGGEEFVILSPSSQLENGTQHAERLRKIIEQHHFNKLNNITCSFGVAEYNKDTKDSDSILIRADRALYRAKEGGRNRVEQEQKPVQ
ncbi:MAG: GGDEF domain-containing protein [Gammaproteobacteria bacterium]|nr:GGDEF domain-containing protein [Gammaproteobacteria bacterium]